MVPQIFNLKTLTGLHSDELSRLIKSLQGIASARQAPMVMHTPPATKLQ